MSMENNNDFAYGKPLEFYINLVFACPKCETEEKFSNLKLVDGHNVQLNCKTCGYSLISTYSHYDGESPTRLICSSIGWMIETVEQDDIIVKIDSGVSEECSKCMFLRDFNKKPKVIVKEKIVIKEVIKEVLAKKQSKSIPRKKITKKKDYSRPLSNNKTFDWKCIHSGE